jgi:hypothetical protein
MTLFAAESAHTYSRCTHMQLTLTQSANKKVRRSVCHADILQLGGMSVSINSAHKHTPISNTISLNTKGD